MMPRRLALPLVAVVFLIAGCRGPAPDGDYVARVGDNVLTQAELSLQLERLPVAGDSLEARDQIIEQWIASELLYREARRRGIRNDADVQRQLEDNERSVMVNALLSRLYQQEEPDVSDAEIAAMYERDKDQLRLREPFVQVRYLAMTDGQAAADVRDLLADIISFDDAPLQWQELANTHSTDPSMSLRLAESYVAESRLFPAHPVLRETLSQLREGQTSQVLELDGQFHILQIVGRAPAGSVPQLDWVKEELTRRHLILDRKQLYARHVQRLRNEALAREDLEIR